jgi:hypothetical protein
MTDTQKKPARQRMSLLVNACKIEIFYKGDTRMNIQLTVTHVNEQMMLLQLQVIFV